MTSITVTLCDAAEDMGVDGTAEDAASWLAYATERLEAVCPDVIIETSRQEGTRFRGGDDNLTLELRDALTSAWDAWCGGTRAASARKENEVHVDDQ